MICSGTLLSALRPILKLRLLQPLPNLLRPGTLLCNSGVPSLILFLCSISSTTGSEYTATPEQLATLSQMLSSMSGRPTPAATPGASVFELIHYPFAYSKNIKTHNTEVSLTDILTPANLGPLFNNHPELIPALFPHLPPDLPVPPSVDVLQRIIQYVFNNSFPRPLLNSASISLLI